MAKLNHQKRQRPRTDASRRRRRTLQQRDERRTRRDLQHWRRSS